MPDLPPMPPNPADIPAWLASLTAEQRGALVDIVRGGHLPAAFGLVASPMDVTNPMIELASAPDTPSAYTVRIDIVGAKPPIWRRLVVRSDVTLDVLHRIVQAAFGWWDLHLHRFSIGDPYTSPFFVTPADVDEGEEGTPEHEARLDQVLTEVGARLTYEYDFGDGWTHDLRLEAAEPWPAEETRTAWCLTGRRAGPLEDSGGIPGYNELAAWVRSGFAEDKAPPGDEDLAGWIPEDFDPDRFSVEETDEAIEAALLGDAGMIATTLGLREEAVAFVRSLTGDSAGIVAGWLLGGGFERADVFDADLADSATQPWRVLLRHIGEGVTLTKAGYLPPAIAEAAFTELGMGERWIGKGTREDHTQPLLWLREQSQELGLLRKSKGRLVPTAAARQAADDPAALLRHIARRLPLGRRKDEQQAGWAVLMATAAGRERRATEHDVAGILADLGWTTETGEMDASAASFCAQPTRSVLDVADGELTSPRRDEPSPQAVLLARLALTGS